MNALLSQSMSIRRKHFMTILHPPDPVHVRAIGRPSLALLQATFKWIDYIGPDSSVTLPLSFYVGMPIIGEKTRKSDKTIAQVIDDRFKFFTPPVLGIQHAWELCRTQSRIPFLRLPGIRRIWFYGLCAYEASGGEFRSVMVRISDDGLWRTYMAPWCDYHPNTDCLALAKL
ncbi:MAG: hypothetical protein EXS60_00815 [Candidatus Pacebacteria bacterium]|nr:hypothetical protein [Candidatus Paceibacterota bacterium]